MNQRIDADSEAYLRDVEAEERLQMRPMCAFCGRHITDDHYYIILDRVLCENCLDEHIVFID